MTSSYIPSPTWSRKTAMGWLGFLCYVLDRPVVDQTARASRYTFLLKSMPDRSPFAGLEVEVSPPSDAAAPPLRYTAIAEQIGLKLEATEAPVRALAIDSRRSSLSEPRRRVLNRG